VWQSVSIPFAAFFAKAFLLVQDLGLDLFTLFFSQSIVLVILLEYAIIHLSQWYIVLLVEILSRKWSQEI
jgi:hypothetical protein